MMKQLVWLGKVFPNRLFVAIGFLFWLHAFSAPATQKCDCPCALDKKQASAAQNPTGQVNIVWPRQDNLLARALHSKVAVQIDADVVGTVDFDAPLTLNLPNGPHKLVVKANETPITVSAQKPLYFKIFDSGINVTASEVDDVTGLALLSGGVKNTWQAAPSGTGTIYIYWPKSGLEFGFLDKLTTDLSVFLDGKRIGVFASGDYLVVKAPSGEHVLSMDMSLLNGSRIKQDVILATGSTLYFHVEKQLDFHIIEDSPEQVAEFAKKGLRQREASAQ